MSALVTAMAGHHVSLISEPDAFYMRVRIPQNAGVFYLGELHAYSIPATFAVDWGDGSAIDYYTQSGATYVRPIHTYLLSGLYIVKIVVDNNDWILTYDSVDPVGALFDILVDPYIVEYLQFSPLLRSDSVGPRYSRVFNPYTGVVNDAGYMDRIFPNNKLNLLGIPNINLPLTPSPVEKITIIEHSTNPTFSGSYQNYPRPRIGVYRNLVTSDFTNAFRGSDVYELDFVDIPSVTNLSRFLYLGRQIEVFPELNWAGGSFSGVCTNASSLRTVGALDWSKMTEVYGSRGMTAFTYCYSLENFHGQSLFNSIITKWDSAFRDSILTQESVDSILWGLDQAGLSNGNINLGGNNAPPSSAGLAYKASLQAKSWTVITA